MGHIEKQFPQDTFELEEAGRNKPLVISSMRLLYLTLNDIDGFERLVLSAGKNPLSV